MLFFFFFQAEDGIRDLYVTGVQTCALPIFMPGDAHDQGCLSGGDFGNGARKWTRWIGTLVEESRFRGIRQLAHFGSRAVSVPEQPVNRLIVERHDPRCGEEAALERHHEPLDGGMLEPRSQPREAGPEEGR